MPDPAFKLSKVQRDLLAFLYVEHLAGGAGPGYDGCIYWRTEGTDSDRAALSRSLRRLEQRGLLLRLNFVSGMGERYGLAMRRSKNDPHNRTTHIRLLPEGVKVGRRLSNEADSDVNRMADDEGRKT